MRVGVRGAVMCFFVLGMRWDRSGGSLYIGIYSHGVDGRMGG